jgi:5-methyltetrahydrofolate--homocysteine methyltransferase
MTQLESIGESLRSGNTVEIRKRVLSAIDEGIAFEVILTYMLDVMEEVGKLFKTNQLFVPEVLIIGRAFNVALDIISPLLDIEETFRGIVVIGTVKGDLHDIGKNLVKLLMGSAGMKVIDLGVDVSPKQFVDAVRQYQPDIVAMSALLTTTMVQISQTIKELKKEGLRDQVKILIGGAPVTDSYSKNIGADFFACDAGTAAEIVRDYLKQKG